MGYTFLVCDLKTGAVQDEYPFTIGGELSRLLQAYGQGTLKLDVTDERTPPAWNRGFLPWRNLVLLIDDRDNILWHGVPLSKKIAAPTVVNYPCATLEAYLLKRYVPDLAFRTTEQTHIARDLASLCVGAGIPLEYDTPASGIVRDRDYFDEDNARVYARLQELAAVQQGFDWTIDVEWADTEHSRVKYVYRTGYPHLGRRPKDPDTTFDYPGNVTAFDYDEAWGEGEAATHVTTVGDTITDAETDVETTPTSEPVIDTAMEAAGWPRLEERQEISGDVDMPTLQSHAHARAAQMFGGQNVITVTARNTGSGSDLARIGLGDTARVTIDTPALKLDAVWVVVGWTITPKSSEYKPTLARLGR